MHKNEANCSPVLLLSVVQTTLVECLLVVAYCGGHARCTASTVTNLSSSAATLAICMPRTALNHERNLRGLLAVFSLLCLPRMSMCNMFFLFYCDANNANGW